MKIPSSPLFKDRTGQIFVRLTVLEYAGQNAHMQSMWKVICVCGETPTVCGCDLRSGNTKSCGCLALEQITELGAARRTHGNAVHGKVSPEYNAWRSMIQRCTNPKINRWHLYGGRGIRICTRWRNSFAAFLQDMGRRPKGKTNDRINPDGHYIPSNCRWATPKQQNEHEHKSKGGAVIPFLDIV